MILCHGTTQQAKLNDRLNQLYSTHGGTNSSERERRRRLRISSLMKRLELGGGAVGRPSAAADYIQRRGRPASAPPTAAGENSCSENRASAYRSSSYEADEDSTDLRMSSTEFSLGDDASESSMMSWTEVWDAASLIHRDDKQDDVGGGDSSSLTASSSRLPVSDTRNSRRRRGGGSSRHKHHKRSWTKFWPTTKTNTIIEEEHSSGISEGSSQGLQAPSSSSFGDLPAVHRGVRSAAPLERKQVPVQPNPQQHQRQPLDDYWQTRRRRRSYV